MVLSPTQPERVARARTDLRSGLAVALTGPEGGALVMAAEAAGVARLAALHALGPVELALTRWRAETLRIRAYDGDLARIAVAPEVDAMWVRALADPTLDLRYPMKGPFQGVRGGDTALHRSAIRLLKAARLLPAALVVPVGDAAALAAAHGLSAIAADDAGAGPLTEVIAAKVPLAQARDTRLRLFRPADGGEEHAAVELGQRPRDGAVPVRLHSACFTGDVLGSLKCDCGPQLAAALGQIGAAGGGVLLYLDQEGRGIGLANKLRAYALQDQGFDTVEANHRLGFEDDERDFRIGAQILRAMGIDRIRLLTNNPAKVARMEANGITVTERLPLQVGATPENAAYLATKAAKSGHLL